MESHISFGAVVPTGGFRLIQQDQNGVWTQYSGELSAAAAEGVFVACGAVDTLEVREACGMTFGPVLSEPEIHLVFASTPSTLGNVLDLANRYGVLRYEDSPMAIPLADAGSIVDLFPARNKSTSKRELLLCGESCTDWFAAINGARLLLSGWDALLNSDDIEAASFLLENELNEEMIGSLSLQVSVDQATGELRTYIMASSLKDAIVAQWASATSANITHRQCRQCTKWFGVHAGHGRPEKLYCSDACRMRAYRRRRAD